jgi:hypothetical protein
MLVLEGKFATQAQNDRQPSFLKDHVLPVISASEFAFVCLWLFEDARGFLLTGRLSVCCPIQTTPPTRRLSLESVFGFPGLDWPRPFSDEKTRHTLVDHPVSSLLNSREVTYYYQREERRFFYRVRFHRASAGLSPVYLSETQDWSPSACSFSIEAYWQDQRSIKREDKNLMEFEIFFLQIIIIIKHFCV